MFSEWLHWHRLNRFWDFASGLPKPGVSPKLCACGKAVVVVLEKVAGAGTGIEDGIVGLVLHWGEDRAELCDSHSELWGVPVPSGPLFCPSFLCCSSPV